MFLLLTVYCCLPLRAQLGFCTGSKGNPIFFENFGSGTNFGPPLPAGTTTYDYIPSIPEDGEYTLHYMNAFNGSWHNVPDHTFDEAPDGTNGKALIVNASTTPGEFYRRVVTGLCVNTSFEFSAWVMNIYDAGSGACSGSGIPIDVTFEIWDATETTLLRTGSTGPIAGTTNPVWIQYGLVFTTQPGQTSVVLKMKNNGAGGCGNDLAIDDIAFRSCGDHASIGTSLGPGARLDVCEISLPLTVPLELSISNLTPHVFQWQESTDASIWTNIVGQNLINYTAPITATRFYRVIIAQDAANLANPYCYTISDIFSVVVTPRPAAPTSDGDVSACSNDVIPPLSVSNPIGTTTDWYDAASGGNLLLAGSNAFSATTPGTYYAQARNTLADCPSATRTAVALTVIQAPQLTDEAFDLCEGDTLTLDAGLPGLAYQWSTGEATQTIQVDSGDSEPTTYTVTVTGAGGCTATKSIVVHYFRNPKILSIDVNEDTVVIGASLDTNSPTEYSIDGIHYQQSPVFNDVPGGFVTGYVRAINGCGQDAMDTFVLSVPKYFTPNADGYADLFDIHELTLFPNARLDVFDRFGKLLKRLNAADPVWDGMFEGKPLPASDYWYHILLDNGMERRGHFTLKR
ncbi:T9SS type B sorting domain-containing protein [Flavobacterium caeni]|uniref:Gliding motility-associated C-terminal domain-containing protein n=1 Tax=Flavobacterium caeni TaxID=490189 RepID=A0A1G5K4G8_9FLAO|nr:T9SS type B sorting domain-containing protein [Flavobacterium caeni]SCY95436.1 gliding motility-associated C-terminal domain-containing protein [Flavobacterium caeni]